MIKTKHKNNIKTSNLDVTNKYSWTLLSFNLDQDNHLSTAWFYSKIIRVVKFMQ